MLKSPSNSFTPENCDMYFQISSTDLQIKWSLKLSVCRITLGYFNFYTAMVGTDFLPLEPNLKEGKEGMGDQNSKVVKLIEQHTEFAYHIVISQK